MNDNAYTDKSDVHLIILNQSELVTHKIYILKLFLKVQVLKKRKTTSQLFWLLFRPTLDIIKCKGGHYSNFELVSSTTG